MRQTYTILALILVLLCQTGCISFKIRNDDPFISGKYLPPWKWIQVDRNEPQPREPQPREPHLSLSVDSDFVIISYLRNISPEQSDMPVLQLIAPFLREIEAELNAPVLRSVWANRLDINLSDEEWPVYRISDDMKYLLWEQTGASQEVLHTLSRRAYWYASVRLDGFSTSYAIQSQSEGFFTPPDTLPENEQGVIRNVPHVPPSLLRTRKYTCESGDQHEELYLIDNGIAWIFKPTVPYDSKEDIFWVILERRDAQEFDPDLEETFTSANRKAEAILKQKGIEGMGSCHAYWCELRTILKKEYGIEWRSPSELNINTMYD